MNEREEGDGGGEPDYWLSLTQVLNVLPDRIILRFDRQRFGDHKLDEPTAEA